MYSFKESNLSLPTASIGKYTEINMVIKNPQDVDCFFSSIRRVALRRNYSIEVLGVVGGDSIYLLCPPSTGRRPHVLVSAGFHGEEPAGCWGILNFLETANDNLFLQCSISFLPLVNPTGTRQGRRHNEWGENPNIGFCHTPSGRPEPSREGTILVKNIEVLKKYGHDGFLSLHEDIDCTEFYIYTFEKGISPGEFSVALKNTEERFFKPMPDGIFEGGNVTNGIVFNHCDGSFEDLMFHEGIPHTACTETPGRLDFSLRVKANAELVKSFVKFHINKFKL